MITPGADLKVYIATRPVDFRKGHDGLAALVQQMFGLDPFSGAAFVFRAKRADRVKILVWDRTGLDWCWCTSGWKVASSYGPR